jgi:hypothetical protein
VASFVDQKMRALGYDDFHVDWYGSIIGAVEDSCPGPALLFGGRTDVAPTRDPACSGQRAAGQESVSKALSMTLDPSCELATTHGRHGQRERKEEPASSTRLNSEKEQSELQSSTSANLRKEIRR